MYIVISYQENYEHRCQRGCCLDNYADSKFDMKKFVTLLEVADYIVYNLDYDTKAKNQFLVFDRWENMVAFGGNYSERLDSDEYSVRCPSDSYNYGEVTRLDEKECNLRRMVRDRLTSLAEDRKLKENEMGTSNFSDLKVLDDTP